MREGWSAPKAKINVISGRGGLGDTLARLPAFKYVSETYPHVEMTIYIQDAWLDLVKYLLPEGPGRAYKRLSEAPYTLPRPIIEFDMERLTTLHLHLTDHAFLIMTDALPPNEQAKAYWQAEPVRSVGLMGFPPTEHFFGANCHDPYILFTTDFTSPARRWPAFHINALGRRVREAGLTAVLIGKSGELPSGKEGDPVSINQNDGINKEIFYDLRNQTTLVESLGLMQAAAAVIGVDNGLLHLAHYTSTPVVVGYTSLMARDRLPLRGVGHTIALEAQVPCGGCQSRGFAVNHDWRTCLFDDYACTLTMSSDRFHHALRELKILP